MNTSFRAPFEGCEVNEYGRHRQVGYRLSVLCGKLWE